MRRTDEIIVISMGKVEAIDNYFNLPNFKDEKQVDENG